MACDLVVVGLSAGGLQALCRLMPALGEELRPALVIVQHRSPESDALCDVLQDCSRLPVSEATDKEPIRGGRIYLAPPDYHLLVEPGYFSLSLEAPVRYSRPSIDVTFESAADAYGAAVVGVVMTGANHDGAVGLRRIVDAGGRAIVQDPDEAEARAMPRAARDAVPEAAVAPVEGIAALILEFQGATGAAEAG